MPCGRIKRPLATAFFQTSATVWAALSSTPLPWGGLSPIIAALRDLLTELRKLLDPLVVAATWNACIKSGWACRATLNIKWEILSTYQKRNNISFREVRTAPSKKQESDWYPEVFYSSQFFVLIIQYLGVGEYEPWMSPVELQRSLQFLLFFFFFFFGQNTLLVSKL